MEQKQWSKDKWTRTVGGEGVDLYFREGMGGGVWHDFYRCSRIYSFKGCSF